MRADGEGGVQRGIDLRDVWGKDHTCIMKERINKGRTGCLCVFYLFYFFLINYNLGSPPF